MQRTRCKNSLLDEHWKRKQRLKACTAQLNGCQIKTTPKMSEVVDTIDMEDKRTVRKTTMASDILRTPVTTEAKFLGDMSTKGQLGKSCRFEGTTPEFKERQAVVFVGGRLAGLSHTVHTRRFCNSIQVYALITLLLFACCLRDSQLAAAGTAGGQSGGHISSAQTLADPRPTIYSGQVSFGLLLSAHSSLGTELSTSASHQRTTLKTLVPSPTDEESLDGSVNSTSVSPIPLLPSPTTLGTMGADSSESTMKTSSPETSLNASSNSLLLNEPLVTSESILDSSLMVPINRTRSHASSQHQLKKRQIFEQRQKSNQPRNVASVTGIQQGSGSKSTRQSHLFETSASCSQINANALYAGMGAIWASHQANLVGDSQLTIGTYVYDSCNDIDVGQRQSVRIVSNLNAFQQTTCEAPRGSPISLTISHGDNQLKAIQLLTSFRVPVVTTKEFFELEDYNQLSREQRRFLFSTAHSSRHLATGALRFTKRIVSRSASSPKLPNQYHRMSSKNGLIVISRNLPSKFISYLTEMIPNHVNYEMLQSHQPIDQIRSVEVLESILVKPGSTTTGSSESRISKVVLNRDGEDFKPLDSSASSISDDTEGSSGDSGLNQEEDQTKMLSPTILMFITPSEAIDLVTRLRNDLAEVSRYYSLVVATREDISPALQTIFHRGGSRLCSGKAFYTISPQPDDIGEFSRYFRDTIQMEGENSDHPLVCEYAKYKSMTKTSSDLDDVSAEPVIKAVWAAAAAFKSVYKKECSGSASNNQASADASASTVASGRVMHSRQSTGKTSECMIKMNKNLSNLVQRALRRLDVTINSTGLQALDGFRIKFDEMNDLMTNKFSIKYINKECEITELGHYSGLGDSNLRLDEEILVKSLESTLPEAWPVVSITPTPYRQSTVTSSEISQKVDGSSPSETLSSSTKSDLSPPDPSTSSSDSDTAQNNDRNEHGKRSKLNGKDEDSNSGSSQQGDEDDSSSGGPVERGGAGSESTFTETPMAPSVTANGRLIKHIASNKRVARKRKPTEHSRKQQQPVLASGRGLASIADSEAITQPTVSSTKARKIQNPPEESTTQPSILSRPMRKLKPFPAQTVGTTLQEWVQSGDTNTVSTRRPMVTDSQLVSTGPSKTNRLHDGDDERIDPGQQDLRQKGTTQAPVVYTTLPESDGNTDLDHPPTRMLSLRQPKKTTSRASLETSATTDSSSYISPSVNGIDISTPLVRLGMVVDSPSINKTYRAVSASGIEAVSDYKATHSSRTPATLDYLSTTINTSPIPLSAISVAANRESRVSDYLKPTEGAFLNPDITRGSRSKLRSHLDWIYSSWFGLTILAANICGALITLYILTFLLLKNCDGSLDRENQGIRSMHLLAIIVVFFGSTLYIVYPTPGLCLLRTSWQNFALTLLFGSLLLQAMQARSMRTLGLGGRPNRLNQFLTLVFMVGVQVSFELQRWKYESSNYVNFIHQHFGTATTEVNKKLSMLTGSISSQLNPLNSFSDQVTPVSIQVSEQYQNLLSDYCSQRSDDYLQSQIYLFILAFLLLIFSASTRRSSRLLSQGQSGKSLGSHRRLTSSALGVASGNLVASQHEANITPSHFQSQFTSNHPTSGTNLEIGNVFAVSMICIPIYMVSVLLHISGQTFISRDLIPSVTMVTVAFSALIGIFLPVVRQIHNYKDLADASLIDGSAASRTIDQQSGRARQDQTSAPAAFTMFPEFAPTGLRRPSSTSGESGSGAGSRRPFSETKESRRNMGTMLANLGPSADSLRSMGFYDNRVEVDNAESKNNASALNLRLDLGASDNMSALDELDALGQQSQQAAKRLSKGEKRLIMLDVDPCCPRHGVAAWPRGETPSSRGCRSKSSHHH